MTPEEKKAYAAAYYKANREKMISTAKLYYAENKEKKKAYDAEYRKANRKKINATIRDWRNRNLESVKAKDAEKRRLNPEKYSVPAKKWREKNKEKLQKYESERRKRPDRIEMGKLASKAWKVANPEGVRNQTRNRRAKLRDGGVLSKGIEKKLMKLQKGKCPSCKVSLEHGFQLDHVIPVAAGGANEDSNVQLLCPKCNQSKGAKHAVDFMQSRGFLI